ncbi:MAG TPA: hypothetical protein HPQ03_14580 [Deltaproteobacteria bacterium]|nr:hypothetical protein [Deltaproteobacteria bacterium]
MKQSRELRFSAERTLGKLAKWLRILGFDTSFEPETDGQPYIEPGRIQLTRIRDRKKDKLPEKRIFITSDHYIEQLRQVLQSLKIEPLELCPFSRCIRCNHLIEMADKTDVLGKVPDFIWETHDVFHICRRCNKIYWPGSHTKRSLDNIQRLFDD